MDILAILNRVEVLLRESGISKSEFYTACSLSASAVSQWKSGKTRPSTKSLQRIADYLHVSYEYLISGVGQKRKTPTPEGERKPKLSSIARLEEGDITPEMDKNIAAYIDFILMREKEEE